MEFGFNEFQSLCAEWNPSAIPNVTALDGLLERLRQILASIARRPALNHSADLIPLVRQALIRRNPTAVVSRWLRFPKGPAWPTETHWRAAAFEVVTEFSTLQVRARKPRIAWLGQQADLFDDAFCLTPSERHLAIPADPFLSRITPWKTYTGTGQREAVRALTQAPADCTIIANLPTGSGKSLLAQLPVLMSSPGRLVLVIVPTIALAIDQARRMSVLLDYGKRVSTQRQLAFHGGLTTNERREIIQALRDGSQSVLFTSPESATQSLREVLQECATAHRITHVVVDEAHLIAGWGNSFRPAFQLLPALVRDLRGLSVAQSIRVVLASATLTAAATRQLQTLFGDEGKSLVTAAVHLRPEPRYAFAFCGSVDERRTRMLEAIALAPRPFILYVTRPAEAIEWSDELRRNGYARIGAFHGKTSSRDRESLLSAWISNNLDGMVATSAFGLGVDKDDVRTVLHATMPESIDRFYQEVGRGGRDGKASTSLLLYTRDDIRQAAGIARVPQLGNEIGFERWTTMLDKAFADRADDGLLWLNVDRVPSRLVGRTKAGTTWNSRLVNMMVRRGLIELVALRSRVGVGNDDDAPMYFDDAREVGVRILESQHRDPFFFMESMSAARKDAKQESRKAFETMLSVARHQTEVSEALYQTYSFSRAGAPVLVTKCCGGCSFDWQNRTASARYTASTPMRLRSYGKLPTPTEWRRRFPFAAGNTIVLASDAAGNVAEYIASTKAAIAQLVSAWQFHTLMIEREIWGSGLRAMEDMLDDNLKAPIFVDQFNSADNDSMLSGENEVRIALWGPESHGMIPRTTWTAPCALQILVVPATLRDPVNSTRHLIDTTPHVFLGTFLDEILL